MFLQWLGTCCVQSLRLPLLTLLTASGGEVAATITASFLAPGKLFVTGPLISSQGGPTYAWQALLSR